jgi:hypothetical protein
MMSIHADRSFDLKEQRRLRLRTNRCAIVVALLVLLSGQGLGAADDQTGFHVVARKDESTVTLLIKSDYSREFVVTLEAKLKNMTPSRPLPLTQDAAGRSSFVLATLRRTDKALPWRYNYHYYWQLGARRASTANDADYAMPFPPGRYVVMQAQHGSYSHYNGSGSENAVDWTVPEGSVVCAAREGRVVGLDRTQQSAGRIRNSKLSAITSSLSTPMERSPITTTCKPMAHWCTSVTTYQSANPSGYLARQDSPARLTCTLRFFRRSTARRS